MKTAVFEFAVWNSPMSFILLLLWTGTPSEWPHALSMRSEWPHGDLNLAQDQWSTEQILYTQVILLRIIHCLTSASQPRSPALVSLLCAVVVENLLVVSRSSFKRNAEGRNKKWHFEPPQDVESSRLLWLWSSQSGWFSLSPEAEKYTFKLIFFQLHDWASEAFQPAPNPQQTPATSSTKTSIFCELNPMQTENLHVVISLSSPHRFPLLPSLIPPCPAHFFTVKLLPGYRDNPVNSPSVEFEPLSAHFLTHTYASGIRNVLNFFVWPQQRGSLTGRACVCVCVRAHEFMLRRVRMYVRAGCLRHLPQPQASCWEVTKGQEPRQEIMADMLQ